MGYSWWGGMNLVKNEIGQKVLAQFVTPRDNTIMLLFSNG